MRKHTPTPEDIRAAVSIAFCTTVEAILSKSQKIHCVVPREVSGYLMHTRGLMSADLVAAEMKKDERWVRRLIQNTRGRMRVDTDFAARVWEAEKIILGIVA